MAIEILIKENGFGKSGHKTPSVLLYPGFMNALFKQDQYYNEEKKDVTFTLTVRGKQKRERKLHNITSTDLMVAITLQVFCHPLSLEIRDVRYTHIHESLKKLFAREVTLQEVKYSILKLLKLEVISINEKTSGRFDLKLLHTEKENGRFVVTHPVIFTEEFSNLSSAAWKLFFQAFMQIGDYKNGWFSRHFTELRKTLHRKHNANVQEVFQELLTFRFNGEPLIAHHVDKKLDREEPFIKKVGKKYVSLKFSFNPLFIQTHEKGKKYHLPLTRRQVYPRVAKEIMTVIEETKVSEYITEMNEVMDGMIHSLKGFGKRAIRYAVRELCKTIKEKGFFPTNTYQDLLHRDARSKVKVERMTIAKEEGIESWILLYKKGVERDERIFEFVNAMSYYSARTVRVAIRLAKPLLTTNFSAPPQLKLEDYTFVTELDDMRFSGIKRARMTALAQYKDPYEYFNLEHEAYEKVLQNEHPIHVAAWLLEAVPKLPTYATTPAKDCNLKIEELLKKLIKQHELAY